MKAVQIKEMRIGEGIPKICIPVVGKKRADILEAARAAGESEADFVEFRADWYEDAADFQKVTGLLKDIRQVLLGKPLLFTFRTEKEGGERWDLEFDYKGINEAALESGCIDLLDVEWFSRTADAEELIKKAHQKNIAVIASHHDFNATPPMEEMRKRMCRMDKTGADILKLAVFPKNKEDVLTLLLLTGEMYKSGTQKPLITMSMGEEGRISRILGEIVGSCVTFGILTKSSAPGQIFVDELREQLEKAHELQGKNLFFIGFMGAGKSTAAKLASRYLGKTLLEMDEILEERAGMRIAEIFESRGEEAFRDMETGLLCEIAKETGNIVSCGGGTVLREENIESMKSCGKIIYLKASPQTIYERVCHGKERPVLNGNMNVEYIETLMIDREKYYEKAADFIVKTDGKSTEELLYLILRMCLRK